MIILTKHIYNMYVLIHIWIAKPDKKKYYEPTIIRV